jgi:hypothetical protein
MDVVLPKDFDANDAPKILDRARRVLDLPNDAQLDVENVTRSARGVRIDFSYTTSVELDNHELRDVAGVRVDIRSHGDLRFNSKGTLVQYQVEPADDTQVRAIRDNLAKLIAADKVYIAEPGENVDPDKLRALGKPWYVEQDAQGRKHLRRAWIS